MFDFWIEHIHCGETTHIFGYDFRDACRRWKIDPKLWNILSTEYVD